MVYYLYINDTVSAASLPRVWSTRRDRKSALTLRLLKSGKFYEGGEDAAWVVLSILG
jgi:hypothetical protein